jgi:aspartate racemase
MSKPAMQTIGLLGGMSWESSAEYYRLLNELVRKRLGGLHFARCVLASVDFADIELLIRPSDSPVTVFPTTRVHVEAGLDAALAGTETSV